MSHQVDEEDVDGYCTGGSYNGDRCGDRQHGGEKVIDFLTVHLVVVYFKKMLLENNLIFKYLMFYSVQDCHKNYNNLMKQLDKI